MSKEHKQTNTPLATATATSGARMAPRNAKGLTLLLLLVSLLLGSVLALAESLLLLLANCSSPRPSAGGGVRWTHAYNDLSVARAECVF